MALDAAQLGVEVVAWCDARSSGSFAALREAPGENLGFTETGRYFFRRPAGEWVFYVDDERLREDLREQSCWVWEPRFFAGEVTAELCHSDGRRAALFLLENTAINGVNLAVDGGWVLM